MSPLLVAAMLGQIRLNDTGSLASMIMNAGDRAAKWLLPNVTTIGTLPIVPDGSVAGRRYIPPNTTIDVVANSDDLQKGMTRAAIVSVIGGAVVGGIVVAIVKRKRK